MPRRRRELNLGDIWLFSTCSGSQLKSIQRQVDLVAVRTGKVLCEEGTVGHEFFFIREGQASVRRGGRKVATLGPGAYFGELSLLDKQPRSATVTAETDMSLLVLERRRFNALLHDTPALAQKLLSATAERLRLADAKAAY